MNETVATTENSAYPTLSQQVQAAAVAAATTVVVGVVVTAAFTLVGAGIEKIQEKRRLKKETPLVEDN